MPYPLGEAPLGRRSVEAQTFEAASSPPGPQRISPVGGAGQQGWRAEPPEGRDASVAETLGCLCEEASASRRSGAEGSVESSRAATRAQPQGGDRGPLGERPACNRFKDRHSQWQNERLGRLPVGMGMLKEVLVEVMSAKC